jgi:plastocyanin
MLEQQRHGAAVERARGRRSMLESQRAVQQRRQLVGRELGAVEEMQSARSLWAVCFNARPMRLLPLAALGLALAFAACGSDSGGQAASSGACPSGAVTIHMKDTKFDPKTASAKAGDTVCWVNDDPFDHNAVANSEASFNSALFGNGKTFTAKLDTAGTVKYECTVHPGMTGEIDVAG